MTEAENPSLDRSTTCPVHETRGECNTGLKCRFLGAHYTKNEAGTWDVTVNAEKQALTAVTETELNFITGETLKQIRSKKVCPHVLYYHST